MFVLKKMFVFLCSLLQVVSAMIPSTEYNTSESQMQAKHILYVKNVVRMLRICGSRHHQLLLTTEGLSSFHSAVVDLIDMTEAIVGKFTHIFFFFI